MPPMECYMIDSSFTASNPGFEETSQALEQQEPVYNAPPRVRQDH